MDKKNIIIVGYPKSGTTWLSRLVAELVKCPIRGDWGFDNSESLYREGDDRVSNFQCYKSHHTFDELHTASSQSIYKIIYIVRDPRDVVISGSHYFLFSNPFILFLKKAKFPFGIYSLQRMYNKLLSVKTKRQKMTRAILYGDAKINPWLKTSWKDHCNGYEDKDVLFITYENALDSTEDTAKQITDYLNITTTTEHIKESIERQSFNRRKKEAATEHNSSLKKLIRKGSHGYWKNEFTQKEKALFENVLKSKSRFYDFS